MNGSAPHPAAKHEWETTAAEICVVLPHEADVTIHILAAAAPPPGVVEAPEGGEATAGVVWRRRHGSGPVVHAYAASSCVDVPLCGSCFGSAGRSEDLPPPPANLGPYRRCRKCMAALGMEP